MLDRQIVKALVFAAVAILVVPHVAFAAAAAGAGMPYSSYLGTFKGSVTGEIAGIICLISVISAVCVYIFGSQMEGLLIGIAKVIIGVGIIGGAATLIAAATTSGAII